MNWKCIYDRKLLVRLYLNNSIISTGYNEYEIYNGTLCFPFSQPKLVDYFSDSRNMIKVKDSGRRLHSINIGKFRVISIFT